MKQQLKTTKGCPSILPLSLNPRMLVALRPRSESGLQFAGQLQLGMEQQCSHRRAPCLSNYPLPFGNE